MRPEERHKQKVSVLWVAVIWGILSYIIFKMVEEPPYIPAPKITHNDPVKGQFSTLDGRHYILTEMTKKHMKDPSSFEHIQTLYKIEESRVIVYMRFRGKNSFNGYSMETVGASFTKDGRFINYVK